MQHNLSTVYLENWSICNTNLLIRISVFIKALTGNGCQVEEIFIAYFSMIRFVETIDRVIANLTKVLDNFEIEYTVEKSHISKSRYIYIIFSGKEYYKFRFSDHDYPSKPDYEDEDREKVAGFWDFRETDYEEAKKEILKLLKRKNVSKREEKPQWVTKIPSIHKDYCQYLDKQNQKEKQALSDYTYAFNTLYKFYSTKKSALKQFYKYKNVFDLLRASGIVTVPPPIAQILRKYS